MGLRGHGSPGSAGRVKAAERFTEPPPHLLSPKSGADLHIHRGALPLTETTCNHPHRTEGALPGAHTGMS